MVAYSKLDSATCQEIIHPWTTSCMRYQLDAFVSSCIGTTLFFVVFSAFEVMISRAKKKECSDVKIKQLFESWLRVLILGTVETTGSMCLACFFRKVLGRFTWFTMALIPGAISGLSVIALEPKVKSFFTITFANISMQVLTWELERMRVLKWNVYHKTLLFMIFNATTSGLISHMHKLGLKIRSFWFFQPMNNIQTANEDSKICWHNNTCVNHITQDIIKYFTTGFMIMLLKTIFKGAPLLKKDPLQFLLLLINWRNYKLSAFFGGYVAVYQVIRCILYRKQKVSKTSHHVLAGVLSGATLFIQPSSAIFNSAIITSIQIIGEIAINQKVLPSVPYSVLIYSICNGFLFHYGIFHPELCSKLVTYVMTTATHGRSYAITQNIREYLKKN